MGTMDVTLSPQSIMDDKYTDLYTIVYWAVGGFLLHEIQHLLLTVSR